MNTNTHYTSPSSVPAHIAEDILLFLAAAAAATKSSHEDLKLCLCLLFSKCLWRDIQTPTNLGTKSSW